MKKYTKNDFIVIDKKSLSKQCKDNNLTANIGYCDGDMHRYHIMLKDSFNEDKKEIKDGFLGLNSLYGFNCPYNSEKHILDMVDLFNTCWDCDACLWVSKNKDIDSCYSISIDCDGVHLMHEYSILKTSSNIGLILKKYLNLIGDLK